MSPTTRGPSPSRSGDQRWAQKASLATHAPPPPAGRAKRGMGQREAKPEGGVPDEASYMTLSSGPE